MPAGSVRRWGMGNPERTTKAEQEGTHTPSNHAGGPRAFVDAETAATVRQPFTARRERPPGREPFGFAAPERWPEPAW